MKIIFFLFATAAAGTLSAWFFGSREKTRHQIRARELESRIRFAQGETAQLREQLMALRVEADLLKNNLEEERRAGASALNSLSLSFRKTLMAVGSLSLVMGMMSGGALAWWTASIQSESRQARAFSDQEVQARIAVLKAELLEKQTAGKDEAFEELRRAYEETRVEKAVALAKLEILLASLELRPEKSGRISMDPDRLRTRLRQAAAAGPETDILLPGKASA